MNHVAQTFRKGHRFRISISTSYFPLAWAPPKPVRLTVFTGRSVLHMPVRRLEGQQRDPEPAFAGPEQAEPPAMQQVEPEEHRWRVIRDLAYDESTLEVVNDHGVVRFPDIDWTVKHNVREWYTYRGCDFDSLRGEVRTERGFQRGDWNVTVHTRTVLTCDSEAFYLEAELDARERGESVFTKRWNRRIPRRLV
jgi:hypothetical protein